MSRKRPGGVSRAIVAFSGDEVVAATSGDESAFAVSTDSGKTFNDISLIDTELDKLEDIAIAPDGSKVYLVTSDDDATDDLSVWRYASRWERILTLVDHTFGVDFIIRLAPDDPDVVYLAEFEGDRIYHSDDGGEDSWNIRTSRYDIEDLAVEEDGDIVYVFREAGRHVSKSTNSGFSWAAARDTKLAHGQIRVPAGVTEPQLVAVAPDDVNYVAIVADDNEVYISDDGGLNWDTLGTVEIGNIRDLALSAEWESPWVPHIVAVAGEDGGVAEVWYYEVGAIGAHWTEASAEGGFAVGEVASAVAFSPNYASDEVMVVITEDDDGAGGTDNVSFQIFSFNQMQWNTAAGISGYPVTIVSDDGITGLDSASISLAPDYFAIDESLRISFVGLAVAGDTNATATSGIYRLNDDNVTALQTDEQIHSVAYDGTNLVAGAYDTTNVWHSADPLATTPTVSSSVSSPSGGDRVVVGWAGSDVVAGTSGNNSAFAVSTDNGTHFTDISLSAAGIDVSDFVVAPDYTTIYATDRESDKLYKSINAGVSWTEGQDTISVGHMIASINMDELLVSSTDGYVSYSTDGNSSWTLLDQPIESGALLTQVTASGLADGDYIYAASSKSDTKVLRWQVGTSTNWTDLAAPTSDDYGAYGIALTDGVLYVQTYDGTDSCTFRTTSPEMSTPSPSAWSKFL
ncbi:MAG: beta propeller repeat protein, partial [Planctomycetota bacterium]